MINTTKEIRLLQDKVVKLASTVDEQAETIRVQRRQLFRRQGTKCACRIDEHGHVIVYCFAR